MRIFLDNCVNHIVIQRMLPYWKKWGHSIIAKLNGIKPDVQLSNVKVNVRGDWPLVFRVDGVYYDKATDYMARNEKLNVGHSTADAIIYQSMFGLQMCERYLQQRKGERGKGASSANIIYNGVEPNWCGVRDEKDASDFNILVSARWRRHKRLLEIFKIFDIYRTFNRNVYLHVLGDISKESALMHDPTIIYYGHLTEKQMVAVFKKAHVFLHLSKKDCCPNSVIEALGAEVPVITTSACGGTVEICQMSIGGFVVESELEKESVEPCCPYTDEYNYLHPAVMDKIYEIFKFLRYNEVYAQLGEQLHIEYTARRYIEVMKGVL